MEEVILLTLTGTRDGDVITERVEMDSGGILLSIRDGMGSDV